MSRRQNQREAEDSLISVTPYLSSDISAAERLLPELQLSEQQKDVVHRMLSIHSEISTSTSFANRMQEAQEAPELQLFRQIGFGSCGVVFEQAGHAHVVKLERSDELPLWNDFIMHSLVQESFAQHPEVLVNIPRCMSFVKGDNEAWWEENKEKFPWTTRPRPMHSSRKGYCHSLKLCGKH